MKAIYVFLSILSIGFFSACKTKTSKACVPNPKPNCVCTMQYEPVCGCDGKTYGNECEANCAQVEVVSKGACKK